MIPKRVTWFVMGAAAGAGGTVYARRKTREAWERVQPSNVAKIAVVKARDAGRTVAEALREGRRAMQDKEAELRAAQERRPAVGPVGVRAVHEVSPAPTFIVVEASSVLDDEYRVRTGPRRRSRRRR
jgi:hypothetical protein